MLHSEWNTLLENPEKNVQGKTRGNM